MLKDFVLALKDNPFKRIVLQTGAKQYGYHLGPAITPSRESDARIHTAPNFYYNQEDILQELAPAQNFTWSVTRPSHIIGAVKGNYMNLAIALGLYLSVQKELKQPVVFPGTAFKYGIIDTFSSANITALLAEFCALTPECANQAFNAANGDVASWQRTFPDLAAYYGVPIVKDQFKQEAPRPVRNDLTDPAPIDPEIKGVSELRNSLTQWAQEPKVIEAWETLAAREGLDKEVFQQASWEFADAILSLQYEIVLSLSKARKYGFAAYVDSTDAFLGAFKDAEKLKFLPKQ
jgi:hypothetical protein